MREAARARDRPCARVLPARTLQLLLAIAALLVAALWPDGAFAQAAEHRIALVVGNSHYVNVPRLPNTANDAQLIASTLQGLGFTLVGGKALIDLDRAGFQKAIRSFGDQLVTAGVGLFYYAGHGLQVQGVNYLVPVDANPSRPADVEFELIDAGLVLRVMEGGGSKLNLMILDACRNNPFGGRGLREVAGGLAQMRVPKGTLISYATQPGNVASDGPGSRNSPYTAALADAMRQPGLDLFDVFNQVGVNVDRTTGGAQQPWVSASPIEGKFYFAALPPPPPPPPAAPAPDKEVVFWQSIKDSNNPVDFEAYLAQYPNGAFGTLARNRLRAIERERQAALPPPPPPPAPAAPIPDKEVVFWQSIKDSNNPANFEAYLRKFPGGVFADLAQERLRALASPPQRPASTVPSPSPPPVAAPQQQPAVPPTPTAPTSTAVLPANPPSTVPQAGPASVVTAKPSAAPAAWAQAVPTPAPQQQAALPPSSNSPAARPAVARGRYDGEWNGTFGAGLCGAAIRVTVVNNAVYGKMDNPGGPGNIGVSGTIADDGSLTGKIAGGSLSGKFEERRFTGVFSDPEKSISSARGGPSGNCASVGVTLERVK